MKLFQSWLPVIILHQCPFNWNELNFQCHIHLVILLIQFDLNKKASYIKHLLYLQAIVFKKNETLRGIYLSRIVDEPCLVAKQ